MDVTHPRNTLSIDVELIRVFRDLWISYKRQLRRDEFKKGSKERLTRKKYNQCFNPWKKGFFMVPLKN